MFWPDVCKIAFWDQFSTWNRQLQRSALLRVRFFDTFWAISVSKRWKKLIRISKTWFCKRLVLVSYHLESQYSCFLTKVFPVAIGQWFGRMQRGNTTAPLTPGHKFTSISPTRASSDVDTLPRSNDCAQLCCAWENFFHRNRIRARPPNRTPTLSFGLTLAVGKCIRNIEPVVPHAVIQTLFLVTFRYFSQTPWSGEKIVTFFVITKNAFFREIRIFIHAS